MLLQDQQASTGLLGISAVFEFWSGKVSSSLHMLNCFLTQSEKKDQSMKTFVLQSFCPLLHSSLPTASFSFALEDWAEASSYFIKCFFVFSSLQGSDISVGFVVNDDLSKF